MELSTVAVDLTRDSSFRWSRELRAGIKRASTNDLVNPNGLRFRMRSFIVFSKARGVVRSFNEQPIAVRILCRVVNVTSCLPFSMRDKLWGAIPALLARSLLERSLDSRS